MCVRGSLVQPSAIVRYGVALLLAVFAICHDEKGICQSTMIHHRSRIAVQLPRFSQPCAEAESGRATHWTQERARCTCE